MRVNVRSLYVFCKAVVPHMTRGGGGSIVNISSGGAGHESTPFMPPGYVTYAVAKAAMERFSTALAPELVDSGHRDQCAATGRGEDGAVGARARRRSRLERMGHPGGCRARRRLPRRTDRRDLHRPGRRLDAVRVRLALSRVYNGRVIIVTGGVRARPETIDEVVRLSLEHVRRSRQNRAACCTPCTTTSRIRTTSSSSSTGPTAPRSTRTSESPSGAFVEALGPLAAEPPTIDIYDAEPLAF